MEDNNSCPILDDLTPKQRLKEFKITIKEVKAKDASKKMVALEKFKNDPRYLLEGEALAPLIESLVPKKKTLDYLHPGLETLVNFFQSRGPEGQNYCLDGCFMLSDTMQSLDVFGVLVEVAGYQDEVKKPKKPKKLKKGEVAPPPPVVKESEIVIRNRYLSCKALSIIARSLYAADNTVECVKSFVAIPDFLQSLCKIIQILIKSVNNCVEEEGGESDKAAGLEAVGFVLDSLLMVLRNSSDSIATFLAQENSVDSISSLLQYEQLTLKSLHIFQYLSSQDVGLEAIKDDQLISSIIGIATTSAETIGQTCGETSKKDSKKGGDEVDTATILTRELSIIYVAVDVFIAISKNAKEMMGVENVTRIVGALARVALNEMVWSHSSVKPTVKADPCIINIVRNIGILFGCFALVDEDMRVCAVEKGCIRVLSDILKYSTQILKLEGGEGESVSEEANDRLCELRHVAEKGILHLSTIRLLPREEGAEDDINGASVVRWKSCCDYVTDCEALRSALSSTGEESGHSNFGVFIDLLECEDEDIAHRSSRLMCILLMATTNNEPVTFLRDLELDESATAKLTSSLLSRATSLSAEIAATSVTSGIEEMQISEGVVVKHEEEEKDKEEEHDNLEEKAEGYEEEKEYENVEQNVIENDCNDGKEFVETDECVAVKVRLQPQNLQQALCNIILCLEYLLNADVSYIKVFSSEEIIEALSLLLCRCGPTCNSENVVEYIVKMNDPRRFDWDTTEVEQTTDELILRELIFDLVTIVGSSDAKYRDFGEASLPQEPCTPFPESTCPCEEEALRVFSITSNACVVTLLCSCDFTVRDSFVTTTPKLDSDIARPVLDAALRLLHSIAGSGMSGIKSMYNAIALRGFDDDADQEFSPLAYFKRFLMESVRGYEGVEKTSDDESFSWEFPMRFQLNPGEESNSIPTHVSEVLVRKETWPFLLTAGSLLSVLANPQTPESTAILAMNAASSLSLITNISPFIQPAALDMFSGALLGLGGVVVLSGCFGLFGPLDGNEEGLSWLLYIIQRGTLRKSYWDSYLEKKLEEEAAQLEEETKTGANKKGGKKDDKVKGKGKGKDSEVAMEFPFEPDEDHPDPNHGPSDETWAKLLNVGTSDLHASVEASQPLIAAIQGGLSVIAQELIAVGAAVDVVDCFNLLPLNHSIVLGYSDISKALIDAGSDVNHLDGNNNSVVKYALFAITSGDKLIEVYKHCKGQKDEEDKEGLVLWGTAFFLEEILDANADLNVSDKECGNFPIHNAIGMGCLQYALGGVKLNIKSKAHQDNNRVSVAILDSMIKAGATVNAVNVDGVSALHSLSALGDITGVEFLLRCGAYPNIIDGDGHMPLHYVAGATPNGCVEVATALLNQGERRPAYRLQYKDSRTGKTLEEKYAIDAQTILDEVLRQTTCPSIVNLCRLSREDLLVSKSDRSESLLQLTMSGDILADAVHLKHLVCSPHSCIENRISLLNFLEKELGSSKFADLIQEKSERLSAIQSFSLMTVGAKPESSSVEVLEFMLNLQDIIFRGQHDIPAAARISDVALNSKTTLPPSWTPVHCAILASSKNLFDALLDGNVSLTEKDHPYVHFVAGLPDISKEITLAVLGAAANSAESDVLLNSLDAASKTPMHVAVSCNNIQFVENMMVFDEVNVNALSEESNRSAFFEAILSENIPLVKAFITSKSTKILDVSAKDSDGKSALDYVFEKRNIELIEALSYDFGSAFVEFLACMKEDESESLLMQIELDNMALCQQLGIAPIVIEEVQKEELVKNDEVEEENLDTNMQQSDDVAALEEHEEDMVVDQVIEEEKVASCTLTDPDAVAQATLKFEQSNALLSLIIGILQDANIIAKDGHAHECFFNGQLYVDFCRDNNEAVCEDGL